MSPHRSKRADVCQRKYRTRPVGTSRDSAATWHVNCRSGIDARPEEDPMSSRVDAADVLDCGRMAPQRHPEMVLDAFDSLAPGGRIRLMCAEAPVAALEALTRERRGAFEWSPVREGTISWQVDVERRAAPVGSCRGVTEALVWDHAPTGRSRGGRFRGKGAGRTVHGPRALRGLRARFAAAHRLRGTDPLSRVRGALAVPRRERRHGGDARRAPRGPGPSSHHGARDRRSLDADRAEPRRAAPDPARPRPQRGADPVSGPRPDARRGRKRPDGRTHPGMDARLTAGSSVETRGTRRTRTLDDELRVVVPESSAIMQFQHTARAVARN